MANDEKTIQNIILENREKLSVCGVNDILTFDEEEIILDTTLGILQIHGSDLKVEKLSTDTGEILAKGKIDEMFYTKEQATKKGGVFKNMFKQKKGRQKWERFFWGYAEFFWEWHTIFSNACE